MRFPIDVKGAEVLLVTPSADFFAEPHIDSLIGYAKVFHATGTSWTLSSMASEAGNFGMFIGNYEQLRKIALRIREAALELGVKRIVVGECGHAWRVAYSFWNTLTGVGDGADETDRFAQMLQKQLDHRYKQPMHICEFTWDMIERNALTFDKSKNDKHIITFHDSCNVARGSRMGDFAGGQFEIPRNIIKAVANNFVEMAPEHHARADLLLRRRRRSADRRPDRPARQGRVAAHGSIAAGSGRARRQFHGDHLRHLQGAVHQGHAHLRIRQKDGGRRTSTGQQCDQAGSEITILETGEMSAVSETPQKITFRRYKDGDNKVRRLNDKIFQAGYSYKCPTYIQSTPPCQGSCPAGEDIRGYLGIVRGTEKVPNGADGKPVMPWQEYAWRRLTEANPFPSVMGRVCPAPCETRLQPQRSGRPCRHQLGRALPRRVRDRQQAQVQQAGVAPSGKKVAILGGGPAGLSCAYQLALKGHDVTIFDEHEHLGGMMRYGIPGFRTPRDVLDAEIQRILDLGVKTRMKTRVGTDITLEQIRKEFDAVFLGMGAQAGRALPIADSAAPNVVTATAFLKAFNDGRLQHVGKRVVVVGGGDTSIDVATVARRLGHISHAKPTDAEACHRRTHGA